MKKDDIVQFRVDRGEMQEGRVLWTKNGNAGIVLHDNLPPPQREAIVMPVGDCEVIAGYKSEKLKHEIHGMETEDLKAAIQRLKGMRFPRKGKRGASSSVSRSSKRQKLTKLLEALDGEPGALDALIDKALEEEKE